MVRKHLTSRVEDHDLTFLDIYSQVPILVEGCALPLVRYQGQSTTQDGQDTVILSNIATLILLRKVSWVTCRNFSEL